MKAKSKSASRRNARDARGLYSRSGGHYYINRGSIDVFAAAAFPDPHTSVRITRKQLEEALSLMDRG